MTARDVRIDTALRSIHPTKERPAWHGAPTARGLLRGVSPEAAIWRPDLLMNCIRDIALHVAFWENSVANRLSGASERLEFAARTTGWPTRRDELSHEQWRHEVALVTLAHGRLVEAVENFDPSLLDEPPAHSTSRRPAISYMHGVAEHSLYHAAQIKLLKQMVVHSGQSLG